MNDVQILIEFKGKITFNEISKLINELSNKMKELKETVNIYKRLLTILVESLENVIKYTDRIDNKDEIIQQNPAFFRLTKIDNRYIIKVTNPVKNYDTVLLKNRLEKLNKFNYRELKQIYHEIISNGQFSDQGGAGLGFIEMMKATGEKIGFSFEKINKEFSYFSLELILKNN
jgi:hypothetical protein